MPTVEKRRKYIGVGGDGVPSLGVLEGDILRLLWDAGEPQSSVQVYEAMQFVRHAENREMQSPSTVAVTLSRMVEKSLLTVERKASGSKGYYYPVRTRAEVVSWILNDVCRRLVGQSLGSLLSQVHAPEETRPDHRNQLIPDTLSDLIDTLRRMEQEDDDAPVHAEE